MSHSTLRRLVAGVLTGLALVGLGGHLAVAQSATGSATLSPVRALGKDLFNYLRDPGSATFGPVEVLGDELSYVDLGVGAFNIQGHRDSTTSPEANIEFRYGKKLFFIGPMVGILATENGGVFGYGGFYSDIALYKHVVITPVAALGGYHRGGGIDLGETFQFRLSATIAYEFNDRSRLGVKFAHISNAGIGSHNPGDNELLLTYALPLHLSF